MQVSSDTNPTLQATDSFDLQEQHNDKWRFQQQYLEIKTQFEQAQSLVAKPKSVQQYQVVFLPSNPFLIRHFADPSTPTPCFPKYSDSTSIKSKYALAQINQKLMRLEGEYQNLFGIKDQIPIEKVKDKAAELAQRYFMVSKEYSDYLNNHPEVTQWLKSMPKTEFNSQSEFGLYVLHTHICYGLFSKVLFLEHEFNVGNEIRICFICLYCSSHLESVELANDREKLIYQGLGQFTAIAWLKFQFDMISILHGSLTVNLIPQQKTDGTMPTNLDAGAVYRTIHQFMIQQPPLIRESYKKLLQDRPTIAPLLMEDLEEVKDYVATHTSLTLMFQHFQQHRLKHELPQNQILFIQDCLWFMYFFSETSQSIPVLHALCRQPVETQYQLEILFSGLAQHIESLSKQRHWPQQHKQLAATIHHLKQKVMTGPAPRYSSLVRLRTHFTTLCEAHPQFSKKDKLLTLHEPELKPLKRQKKPFPETPTDVAPKTKSLEFRSDTALQHLLKTIAIFEKKVTFKEKEITEELTKLGKHDPLYIRSHQATLNKSKKSTDSDHVKWYMEHLDTHPFARFVLTEPHIKVQAAQQKVLTKYMKSHLVFLQTRFQVLLAEYNPAKNPAELVHLSTQLYNDHVSPLAPMELAQKRQELLSHLKQRNHHLTQLIQTQLMVAHCNTFVSNPKETDDEIFVVGAEQYIQAVQQRLSAFELLSAAKLKVTDKQYAAFVDEFAQLVFHGEHCQLNYLIFEVWPNSKRFNPENHQQLLLMKVLFEPDNFLAHLQALDAIEYQQYSLPSLTFRLCLLLAEQYQVHTSAIRQCQTLAEFKQHQQKLHAIEFTISEGWLHRHIYACTETEALNVETSNTLLQLIIHFPRFEVLSKQQRMEQEAQKSRAYIESLPPAQVKPTAVVKPKVAQQIKRKPTSESATDKTPTPEPVVTEEDKLLLGIEKMSQSDPQLAIERFTEVLTTHSGNTQLCIRARIGKANAAMQQLNPVLDILLDFYENTLKFNEGFRQALNDHELDPDTKIVHPTPKLFTYMVNHCISKMPTLANQLLEGVRQAQLHVADIDAVPSDITLEPKSLDFCRHEIQLMEHKIVKCLQLLQEFETLQQLRKEFNVKLRAYHQTNPGKDKGKTVGDIQKTTQKYEVFSKKVQEMRQSFSELQHTCQVMKGNTEQKA